MKALIFDCDGVLVDTERDGHRVAFNKAFASKAINIEWSVSQYGELVKVAGGKERMKSFFDEHGWPDNIGDREEFILDMHKLKTKIFMDIIESGELALRPGIARVVDEAIREGLKLAVCSTSNEKAVTLIVEKLLGPERRKHFDTILAGDVVSRKKPDPEIYNLVLHKLSLKPQDCVVIEDSRNGFLAAHSAEIHCLITTNGYTSQDDFTGADMIVPELGDLPNDIVTINDLIKLTT
ncbi:MAG: HAD-IA family hydrolase [Cyclobacteriaceae bacterium]|nr:HAD-IA family hydrolase [Cyclobacteriaceae bacterium]